MKFVVSVFFIVFCCLLVGFPALSLQVVNDKPKYGELTLEFEEETVIRESNDNEFYTFRYIWDLVVDSRGSIYLLDHDRVLKFDKSGRFLRTIGRKGQGPGEYMKPLKLFIDGQDNLYISDQGISLLKFDREGNFKEIIKLKFSIPFMPIEARNFYVSKDGRIVSFTRDYSEEGIIRKLVLISQKGEIIKVLASFLEKHIKVGFKGGGGVVGGVTHPYLPSCYFCSLGDDKICFGENMSYKITIMDLEGNELGVFYKNEEKEPISSREKKYISQDGQVYFPPYRPFFKNILSDEKNRLYVFRIKPILVKSKREEIDVFNARGVYLYKLYSSYAPWVIKNGYVYTLVRNKDGLREVKRLKIKGYEDFKN